MAVNGDPEHLPLHPPIEALHEAVGLRRVGLRLSMVQLQLAASLLKTISRKARAAVGEHVGDLEGESADRLFEEGDRAGRQLVVLDGQMHPARTAVDGHIQIALAALAIRGLQFRQVLDVHVHEAEVILLERAAPTLALMGWRKAPQPFGFEDAVDGIPVEMRQEVRDHKGEVIEPVARRRAQTIARSSSLAFQGSL
jgi:hypothetical protein